MTFYNEGLSTLLRTIYSILHTSPKKLLREIILIDDFSDLEKYPDLGKPLDDEVKKLKIVKFIRSSERKGLVRARLLGAKMASGNVLTFLDCHIECNEGKNIEKTIHSRVTLTHHFVNASLRICITSLGRLIFRSK